MRRSRKDQRGITLLETMVTAVVLILGISAVASTVVAIVRLNRRNLSQSQAYTVAEWSLERLTRIGCTAQTSTGTACDNLKNLPADQLDFTVYWNPSGSPTTGAPKTGVEVNRPYLVSIDVDPPFEGNERGSPLLSRTFGTAPDLVTLQDTVNVRVTVSWQDDLSNLSYHAVALQTRVGP